MSFHHIFKVLFLSHYLFGRRTRSLFGRRTRKSLLVSSSYKEVTDCLIVAELELVMVRFMLISITSSIGNGEVRDCFRCITGGNDCRCPALYSCTYLLY